MYTRLGHDEPVVLGHGISLEVLIPIIGSMVLFLHGFERSLNLYNEKIIRQRGCKECMSDEV